MQGVASSNLAVPTHMNTKEFLKSGGFASIWQADIYVNNADQIIGIAGTEVEVDEEGIRITEKGW